MAALRLLLKHSLPVKRLPSAHRAGIKAIVQVRHGRHAEMHLQLDIGGLEEALFAQLVLS